MKVVITDYTFPSLEIEEIILSDAGIELAGFQCKAPEQLMQCVADADAVIAQFAPITAEVIGAMSQTRVIVRYGIGVDNVDLEAARARHIPVCNVPDYCIDEVADHTLALVLATTRQVVAHATSVHSGKWGLATAIGSMLTLRDLTVGVIGFGRIGREVALRLRAFKCRVVVHDPFVAEAEIERAGCRPASLQTLYAESHVVTLHCPSTAYTRGMINQEALRSMRPGVILINVARGDLVDTAAFLEALESGHVAAAALDVFAPEPIPGDHPVLRMENVIITPHIASASLLAVQTLRKTAANLALKALRNEPLCNVVNCVKRHTLESDFT
jgi:D-3-phosphoglycerate dehydrogenase